MVNFLGAISQLYLRLDARDFLQDGTHVAGVVGGRKIKNSLASYTENRIFRKLPCVIIIIEIPGRIVFYAGSPELCGESLNSISANGFEFSKLLY